MHLLMNRSGRNRLGAMILPTAFALAAVTAATAVFLTPAANQPQPVAPATVVAADAFDVDGVHSSLLFKIRHAGVSNFYGRVNNVKGEFTFDESNPAASKVHIHAETKDIDTGNDGRDNHLAAPDFFNARENPTLSFVSSSVKPAADGGYDVTGNLTLHGVTKEITVSIDDFAAKDAGPRMGFRAGFETQFTIKRSDYGMDLYVKEGVLGDDVTIIVAIEGTRR
jgi:polyisoprenoid-binding protein YceI